MKIKNKTLALFFSLLMFVTVFSLGSTNAEAATNFVDLKTNQSSSSTTRITTKSTLLTIVNNVGSKPIYYNVFRNGELYASGLTIQPGQVANTGTATVKSGEYSLRIYCGSRTNPQSSGCQAKGTITGN